MSTTTGDYTSGDAGAGLAPVPALTILAHPDPARAGERVVLVELLAGRAVALSREVPGFAAPGLPPGPPLDASCISRTPLFLEPLDGGGVRIRRGESRTRLDHRGAPVAGDLDLSDADLRRGAVLRLGGMIVLLLHHVSPGAVRAGDAAGLVGESDGIQRVRIEIARVADLDMPVLVRGETGTGKELVARAVHAASARRGGPFVAVNLGAIAPEIAAAELFGAERGSFTGAVKREGHFGAALGGTLFLDEIGEAPPAIQVMLLRALETGEVQRVGASVPHRTDVRLVAATDADLETRIQEGSFRAPLFHRLSACQIWIPPLRERRDDIGRLLLHFLRAELERTGELGRLAPSERPWLPPSLVARLAELDWPGNVRQLQNAARQLVISGRARERVEIGPAIERLLEGAAHAGPPVATAGGAPRPSQAVFHPLSSPPPPGSLPPAAAAPEGISPAAAARRKPAEVTDEELFEALRASRWELAPAAERLRISRASMYVLVERSGELRTAGDLSAEEITRAYHECGGHVPRMVDRLEVSEKALRRRLRELGLVER